MKITDLNFDCLEKVFIYLSLSDLTNVSDSNKYLKNCAEIIFVSRYKRHFFRLFVGSETSIGREYRNIIAENRLNCYDRLGYTDLKCIELHSLKDCLKVLRCFGHLISKLSITIHHFRLTNHSFDETYLRIPKIYRWKVIEEKQLVRIASARVYTYASKYCSGSLNEIVIDDCIKGNINYLRKSFLNVERVHIQGLRMKGDWLNRFPKMQYLEIDLKNIFTSIGQLAHWPWDYCGLTSFEHHFPNLKHLKLCPIHIGGGEISENLFAQIYRLLRLNPQLQILEVPLIGHRELLRAISEGLPHLQYLTFNHTYMHYLDYNGDRDIYRMKNVKKFVFQYFLRCSLPDLLFTFDKLEEFHFFPYHEFRDLQRIFYSFVKRHTSIRKFVTVLASDFDRHYDEEEIIQMVLRIVEALPNLKEIGLGCKNFTHSCAAKIIERCNILNRYRFWCDPMEPYHRNILRLHPNEKIGVEWWFYTE